MDCRPLPDQIAKDRSGPDNPSGQRAVVAATAGRDAHGIGNIRSNFSDLPAGNICDQGFGILGIVRPDDRINERLSHGGRRRRGGVPALGSAQGGWRGQGAPERPSPIRPPIIHIRDPQ
jgi:hypothetical protein